MCKAPNSWLQRTVIVALVLCEGACPQRAGSEVVGFTYAEGYSSAALDEPIDLGFRAFSLGSRPCDGLPVTHQATAEPSRLELRVGERYFLPNIVLRVYDAAGQFVPRAPLFAHLTYDRDVLTFESDNDRNFWVIGHAEGSGVANFAVDCAETPLLVKVPITVLPDR